MGSKEQRKTKRKRLDLRASASCSDAKGLTRSTPVRMLDLSTAGALIESSAELFINQVCTFGLVTSDARNVPVQGHVIWIKQEENGLYQAGIAFRNLTADEEYLISLQMVRG